MFDIYPDSTVIYPEQGDDTTLGAERPKLATTASNGNSLRSASGTRRVLRGVVLELVTDGAQQIVPVGHVAIGLDPKGRLSVDDADNATATRGHCDQDVNRIGCGAVDRADLGQPP